MHIKPISFKSQIVKIEQNTPRVKVFKLKIPENIDFKYKSGQFVTLSIDDFFDKEKGILMKRPYSIASSPLQNDCIELCISWAHPGGFSDKMHQLKEGDIVNVSGPYGIFTLKPLTEDLTFIAAGSGIAPLMDMVRTIFLDKTAKNIWLFFGFRYPEDFIYKNELTELAQNNKNFHLITSISAPDVKEWSGERGRINFVLPKYIKNAKKREFYLCGPPPMIEDTTKVLAELGANKKRIYIEKW